MNMLPRALTCLVAFCICALAFAADAPPAKTVVEVSLPRPPAKGLSTTGYPATERERTFLKKVTEQPIDHWATLEVPPPEGEEPDPAREAEDKKRRVEAMTRAKVYSLAGQVSEYVGWCGIVRQSTWNDAAGRTELLVQHCHYDGLTDAHIQVVSIYGAGDFRALVPDRAKDIPPLGLVRVYGRVSLAKDGVPEVAAEYVRVWDWGLFTFMNYGIDKTNPTWRALRRVEADDVYTPRPTQKHFEAVLGKREASATKPDPTK